MPQFIFLKFANELKQRDIVPVDKIKSKLFKEDYIWASAFTKLSLLVMEVVIDL